MKVKAKYNFAYLGIQRLGGEVFTCTSEQYKEIANEVEAVEESAEKVVKKTVKKAKDKQVKKSRTK